MWIINPRFTRFMLGGSDVVIASHPYIVNLDVRDRLRRRLLINSSSIVSDAIARSDAGRPVLDCRYSCWRPIVTWTNTDSVSHTSTSDANAWNSGTVAPGGRFSFAFQTAGTFPYRCTIHPGMVGTVVVR